MPVLSVGEAAALASEASTHGGAIPSPHPELARTPSHRPRQESASTFSQSLQLARGAHTEEILSEIGVSAEERATLLAEGTFDNGAPGAKL